MPRLLKRQDAPFEPEVKTHRIPVCIACGNRRTFWVREGKENKIENAWEISPEAHIVACGRCRARNSILFDRPEA